MPSDIRRMAEEAREEQIMKEREKAYQKRRNTGLWTKSFKTGGGYTGNQLRSRCKNF
jgi:hypothetical protein